MIVTMLNITLKDVVEVAVGISPDSVASDPCTGTAGGLAIVDLEVVNATTGLASYRPGDNPAMPWLHYPSDWNGTGVGALLVRNASFTGPGAVGALLTQTLPRTRFSGVSFSRFGLETNGTAQPVLPYVLTPRVMPTTSSLSDGADATEWVVWFENSGMGKGTVTLTHLDDGLKANASTWEVGPASGGGALGITGADGKGGCGVLANGAATAGFCCVAA